MESAHEMVPAELMLGAGLLGSGREGGGGGEAAEGRRSCTVVVQWVRTQSSARSQERAPVHVVASYHVRVGAA